MVAIAQVPDDVDVLDAVAAAHEALRVAQGRLAAAVRAAHERGASWKAIGQRLGVGPGAVRGRYGPPRPAAATPAPGPPAAPPAHPSPGAAAASAPLPGRPPPAPLRPGRATTWLAWGAVLAGLLVLLVAAALLSADRVLSRPPLTSGHPLGCTSPCPPAHGPPNLPW